MRRIQGIRTLSVATAGVFLIAGCSSGDEDAPTPTFAEQAAGVEDVDPAAFERSGTTSFDYRTGDEGTGTCIVDDEAAVTCTGEVPDDAPDIEVPPFERQRPGAARITTDGVTYTMVEGAPPAPAALEPGQRLTVGDASCEMSEDAELSCSVGETTLDISGDDSTMTLTGDVLDHEYHVSASETPETPVTETPERPAGVDGDYSDTDEPVAAGTMCGAASGNTLVKVREGSVSCLDAQAVVDDYRERRDSEGGGNTLAMRVGEWDCSSPTAGRAADLDAGEICYGPDDVVIATPPGSVQP